MKLWLLNLVTLLLMLIEKVKKGQLLAEIDTPDFDADDSNYGKVVIMTDADTDGAHIQVLLLTFFYRYMRGLIQQGKVFIALPPLYKISKKEGKKNIIEYAWNEEESFKSDIPYISTACHGKILVQNIDNNERKQVLYFEKSDADTQ